MKTVGLITEYNPFHNGHLRHLRESLRVRGAEAAVAVMSGHFLQRGEPALVDKWVRTEMALAAGVDLVLELPLPFACNSAPHFAAGAVRLLDALGVVDTLCFGSEAGELAPLEHCARLLREREADIEEETAALLRRGLNYPAARAQVVAGLAGEPAAEILASPNNILAIAYLKALAAAGSVIRPCTIRRIGAGYHDLDAAGDIASATGIRRMLAAGEAIDPFIPPAALPPFRQALTAGRRLDPEALHRLTLAAIFARGDDLSRIYLADAGIANRLRAAAETAASREELAVAVKSRHLTLTRVQRLLTYVLLDLRRDEMAELLASGPLYLRLLGASRKGRDILAASRKRRSLPLIANLSRVYPALKRFHGAGTDRCRLAEGMLRLDLRATRLYTLLMERWDGESCNRDFFEEVRLG